MCVVVINGIIESSAMIVNIFGLPYLSAILPMKGDVKIVAHPPSKYIYVKFDSGNPTFATRYGPVSYTHLDVYKRQ